MRYWPLLVTLLVVVVPLRAEDSAKEKEPTARPQVLIKTSHGDIVVELFPKEAPETVANFLALAAGDKEFKAPGGEMVKRPFYDGLTFHRIIKGFMLQGGCPVGNGSGSPGYKFKDEINANSLGLDKFKVMKTPNTPHPWLLIRSQADFQRNILLPLCRKIGIKTEADFKQRIGEIQKAIAAMTIKESYENLGYKYDPKLKSRMPKKGTLAMANSGANTNGSQFFINMVDNDYLAGKHTVFGRVISGWKVAAKLELVKVAAQGRPVEPITIVSIRPLKVAVAPEKEATKKEPDASGNKPTEKSEDAGEPEKPTEKAEADDDAESAKPGEPEPESGKDDK